jgi:glycosyltransferase involved in cell wall biosynthesis
MHSRRPVIYDISRLVTRFLNDTPNGIDRVDLALARHFLSRTDDEVYPLLCTFKGPSIVPAQLARNAIEDLEGRWWRESGPAGEDEIYDKVVTQIIGQGAGRVSAAPRSRATASLGSILRYGLCLGHDPARTAPSGSRYINASTFPLELGWYLNWLRKRTDIKSAFFIHDLLPIEYPQYFWEKEPARQRRRLDNIRSVDGAAIVSLACVAARLKAFAGAHGYAPAICQAAPPVSSVFRTPRTTDPRLANSRFFLACGTIEPRKNHVLLLDLWRELVDRLGPSAPVLVIAGKRGWNNEEAVGRLERSRPSSRVVEVAGLSTPALKRLMDGATALLAPSFGEGFGLPVAEALAAELPVVASDIEPFREFNNRLLRLIDPLDGLSWLQAIQNLTRDPVPGIAVAPIPVEQTFTSKIDDFLEVL